MVSKTYIIIFAIILILTLSFSLLINSNNKLFATNKPVGMVVTSQHLATDVGVNILRKGGNAIDAAVAIGFALAVVEPCCGNLGGGGFMLIHLANGKNVFLDFREKAPLAIKASFFLDKTGKPIPGLMDKGYLAVAIPGTVLGLAEALSKYGTMALSEVIQPAIALAKNGFVLKPGDVSLQASSTDDFNSQPNMTAIFFKNGKSYQTGDRLVQKNLAMTLQQIAAQGAKVFYQGTIADEIVQASKQQGGVITKEDFSRYAVKERQPIICNYRGYQVITAPPPSAGGITLCEMLNITQAYPLRLWGYRSAMGAHYILEAMRYAYADRNSYLGDPDFVNNPVAFLLSPQHAQKIRAQILPYHAGDSRRIGFISKHTEKPETTHFSIIDKYGNAVSVTYTLNGYFGSKVIAGNSGFFLNNEMDDFTLRPGLPNEFKLIQGTANVIQPEKRPLSSMTPTIILKNNKVFMVLGAPGGSTIPTQVLETIENVIDYDMSLQKAVDAPRYHLQWLPDIVYMEPDAFPFLTLLKLHWMGYKFELGSPYGVLYWGAVAAVLRNPETGQIYGAIDHRPQGLALGT